MRILFLLILSSLLNVVTAQNLIAQRVNIESAITKSYNGSDVSCANSNDAQITVTASGGSGNYQYSKDNGLSYQTSNILTGLKVQANTIVRVRDADNHTTISEAKYVWIANVERFVVNTFDRLTFYNGGQDGISCAGSDDGDISIRAHGGTEPYTYSIDGGETFQPETIFKRLTAGTYRGMAKDANGCIAYYPKEVTLIEPQPIVVKVLSLKNATSENQFGSITIMGEGSKGDYEFSIDGSAFFFVRRGDSFTFEKLNIGRHQVIIKENQHGCPGIHNFEIAGSLSATLSAHETVCEGEDINLIIDIIGKISSSEMKNTYTAIYKDDKMNIFTKTDLKFGGNIFSIGELEMSTTFKLISVTSKAGSVAYVADAKSQVIINPTGTWLGLSNDWHDPKNWPCGQIPNNTTKVYIGPTSNDPVIDKKTGMVNNLAVGNGASLKVNSLLQISGWIKIQTGLFDVTQGSLEFNGTGMQDIAGKMFKNKTVHNLIVSNNNRVQVNDVFDDTLNITGNVSFGIKNGALYTGDNITLKSTIDGTANIGVVGEENVIVGKFIVERYINTGTDKKLGQHGKAWMLLATPTIGSTIFESWQEEGKSTGKTPVANNNKGFGTLLTTGYKNVPDNGFDLYTVPGPSIKTYNFKSGTYDKGPESTYDDIYNEKGYLVLVRGDRSVYTSNGTANPVVLRTKGDIITGTTKPMEVAGGRWESIGNPYASRIYIDKIQRTGGVKEFISVWDPKLGSPYGLGAFQTLYSDGRNYYAMPGGGSYGKEPVTFIESGQAFFVQATKEDGTVFFTEDSKIPSEKGKTERGGGAASKFSSLRSSLFALGSGEAVLVDGNILLTGDFSNDIDGRDARKMGNSAENFGIISSGQLLTIESRQQITSDDNLIFSMTGMRSQDYFLELRAEDLGKPDMESWLVDAFTSTKTLLNLNGTTEYKFTVSNQPGAAASNRFMIIFRTAEGGILPVTFTEVKATLHNENVLVEWRVEAESNLKQYEVEKSLDGSIFSKAATVSADNTNGGKYQWLDQTPGSGFNYYRIRSVDLDGRTSLTQIVKVKTENSISSISVYPNPIANGTVNVHLGNQPEGIYNLRLLNPVGQVLLTTKINHAGGNHTEKINWDHSFPKGMYTLEVTHAQAGVKIIKLMY